MQAIAFVSSLLLLVALAAGAPSDSVPSAPVVGSSPNQPVVSQVEGQQQPSPVVVEHSHVVHHNQHQQGVDHVVHHNQGVESHQHQPVAGYYSPVGVPAQPVPEAVHQVVKPIVRNSAPATDQYGQPESAALPPNYKPFGSWGLYIGGNPADGYYTNYYKALSSSVDKQQGVEGAAKPAVLTRQSAIVPESSSPYVGGDFYSYAYSPNDLNTALPVHSSQQQQPPATVGQFYGAPTAAASPVDPSGQYGSLSPYSDFYASKKIGQAALFPRQLAVEKPSYYSQQQPAVVQQKTHQQQQQIVSYPVPVGSQIVGSQPGVDGAFDPYGIHAFTRYAVKPTVVNQADSGYYYSYPQQVPYTVYKQHPIHPVHQEQHQQHQHQASSVRAHQPVSSVVQPVPVHKLSSATGSGVVQPSHVPVQVVGNYSPYYGFYGYPVNQLHYSQGMIVPVEGGEHSSNQQHHHHQQQHHQQHPHHHHHDAEASAPSGASQSEPSSDKVDSVDQLKPQK